MKFKYLLGDCEVKELHIEREKCDYESDGEFVFDTLKEAKAYALEYIERDINELLEAKKRIEETKFGK